jgi:DegV family protein with EDD domain
VHTLKKEETKHMGIRIITDSTSEMTQAQSKELGVPVVPIMSVFADREYREGIDLLPEDFYKKLDQAENLPTTSQPSPGDFDAVYREALAAGDKDIIVICISSKLSGTYESALIAKEAIETSGDAAEANIQIIDSENTTVGLHILVQRAIELRDKGQSADEIVQTLEEAKKNIRLYAAIETLEYLHKGGRLSTTSKVAGTLLNVKPLITVTDGEIKVVGKCRGMKKACDEVFNLVEEAGGINFDYPVALGYTGDKGRFDLFEEISASHFEGQETPAVFCIGCAIGTHVGPGAVAIAFFTK